MQVSLNTSNGIGIVFILEWRHRQFCFVTIPFLKPVTQEVKSNLFGRRVGDVTGIGCRSICSFRFLFDDADRHSEQIEHGSHQFGIASRQVIIGGCQVSPFSRQSGQVQRQSRRQRFAFSRLHDGDGTVRHGGASDQLNGVMPHAKPPCSRLTHQSKGTDEYFLLRSATQDVVT